MMTGCTLRSECKMTRYLRRQTNHPCTSKQSSPADNVHSYIRTYTFVHTSTCTYKLCVGSPYCTPLPWVRKAGVCVFSGATHAHVSEELCCSGLPVDSLNPQLQHFEAPLPTVAAVVSVSRLLNGDIGEVHEPVYRSRPTSREHMPSETSTNTYIHR